MPNRKTSTMEHVAFTDHAIPRRPATAEPSPHLNLVSFWPGVPPAVRDMALAYAIAGMTEPLVRRQAFDLLQQAEAKNPKDIPVLVQLAQYYDRMGNEEKAMDLCERIVRLDPAQSAASINLGIYRMNRGRAKEAMDLWAAALMRNPALSAARLNLGVAQYRAGAIAAAVETLKTALFYDPDLASARKLLKEIERSTNAR
jgi:tetratricopeptide (TPR) repeat protein